MKLSANQAHKRAGIAKKTLLKALDDGVLSASKNDLGHWQIDQSELDRVYPQQVVEQERPRGGNRDNTTETLIENRVMAVRLEEQEKTIHRLERDLEKAEQQREGWQAQAERLLLERPQTPAPSLWDRLTGRRRA